MIKVGDEYYYIDIETLSEVLYGKESTTHVPSLEKEISYFKECEDSERKNISVSEKHSEKPKEVDGLKYELIRAMLDIVMNVELEFNEITKEPANLEEAPSNFAFAFNTLLKLKILKTI